MLEPPSHYDAILIFSQEVCSSEVDSRRLWK